MFWDILCSQKPRKPSYFSFSAPQVGVAMAVAIAIYRAVGGKGAEQFAGDVCGTKAAQQRWQRLQTRTDTLRGIALKLDAVAEAIHQAHPEAHRGAASV